MRPAHIDLRQACDGALGAFGPKPSVRVTSAGRRRGGRSAAVLPFSGPRSRGATERHNAQSRHHRPCHARLGRDRRTVLGLRPGAPPPPCGTQGGAPRLRPPPQCPGQGAWGTGAGPIRGVLELRAKTPVMTETRSCTPSGAPRACAGERAPSHLPLLHTRTRHEVKVSKGLEAVLHTTSASHASRLARSAVKQLT